MLGEELVRRTLGLRYLALGYSRLLTTSWPVYLTFFVTARCNARCPHCFYWREADAADTSKELTPDEVERIAATIPRLPLLLLSGGEPTLRDDLAGLVEPFVRSCSTEVINLPTNGLLPDRVERSVSEVLDTCRPARLRVNLSLDGPEEVHDAIRGTGAYSKLLHTRWRLDELARREPRLDVAVNLTLSRLNVHVVEDTLQLLSRPPWNSPTFSVTLARPRPRDPEVLGLSPEEVERAFTLVREQGRYPRGFGHRPDLLSRAVTWAYSEHKRVAPCRAGLLEAVLTERGVVYPCEMLDRPLGDLREEGYDFGRVWMSEKAIEVREEIARGECWCTHETDLSNACRFWPPLYPWLVFGARESDDGLDVRGP